MSFGPQGEKGAAFFGLTQSVYHQTIREVKILLLRTNDTELLLTSLYPRARDSRGAAAPAAAVTHNLLVGDR